MKKTVLLFIIFQLSIFLLQAQTSTDEKEQLKQINQELVTKFKAGKMDDALSLAQKAVDLSLKIYGAESLETAVSYKNLGIIFRVKKKYKEAIANLQKATEIYRLKPEQNAKSIAQTLDELSLAFALNGDTKQAEVTYTLALTTAEKAYGKESKEILPFLKSMAEVYILVKKYDEAQAMFVRQYLTARKYFQPGSKELQEIEDSFDCFTYQTFKMNEANERQKAFNEAIHPKQETVTNVSNDKSINGGVINGKAKYLAVPAYPASAREKRAQGTVSVRVTIDEEGKVTEAKAICGDVELRAVSEEAARNSKFMPTLLSGKPVKVIGTIIYKFIP